MRRTPTALLCAFLVAAAGCQHHADHAETRHQALTSSGQSLYAGLFLGYGAATALVPEIHDHLRLEQFVTKAADRQRITRELDKLVARVGRLDPRFFDRFKAQVTSGDHHKVKKAYAEATKVTMRAVREMPEYAQIAAAIAKLESDPKLLASLVPPEVQDAVRRASEHRDPKEKDARVEARSLPLTDVEPPNALPTVIAIPLAIAAVVHTWVALQSWVAITTVGYLWVATKWPDATDPSGGTLLQDRIVDSVAVRLGPG